MDDRGPLLDQKGARLSAQLLLAETPVEVTLVSDGLTEVTVNRVGRFGAFQEKKLSLVPGRYVVRRTSR